MKRVDLLPNLLSLGNMYCGLAAIFAVGAGEVERAAWLVILAILFDAFDGKVARLTRTTSEFGKELDSLSDLVSFGIAPALLIYEGVMTGNSRAGALIAAVYATTTALRLARFNVGRASKGRHFIGLPAPAAGGMVASYTLFVSAYDIDVAAMLIGPLILVLALLMVSPIPYPKDRLFEVSRRWAFGLLFVSILCLAVFHAKPKIMLFLIGLAYTIFGPWRVIADRKSAADLPDEETVPQPTVHET